MKIFIICCLLFIHVNMCIYPRVSGIHSGFGYPFGFRVSAGLDLVMNFHPNRFSGRIRVSISGFGFGCTETPPDPNPTYCHPYREPRSRRHLLSILIFINYYKFLILWTLKLNELYTKKTFYFSISITMKRGNERCMLVLMSYYKIPSSTYANCDFELKWHINKKYPPLFPI